MQTEDVHQPLLGSDTTSSPPKVDPSGQAGQGRPMASSLIEPPQRQRRWSPSRFFQWLAGADAPTLARVPWERSYFTAVGLALLIPFVAGAVGATAMLHIITGKAPLVGWFVLAGVGWGLAVLTIDRLLVRYKPHPAPMDDGAGPSDS